MSELWVLEDYQRALAQLEDALTQPATSNLLKAGCIQYFEFCFELAWKSVKAVAREFALPDCLSPKACLKQAFAQGWIADEEVWLLMLEARNRMSHTYNADDALTVYAELGDFLPELRRLYQELKRAVNA